MTNYIKIKYIWVFFFVVWSLAFLGSIVEVFTYTGFIFKYSRVISVFLLALLTSLTWLVLTVRRPPTAFIPKIATLTCFTVLVILTFSYFYFPHLERINFINYAFDKYHPHIQNIFWPWFLSLLFISIADRKLLRPFAFFVVGLTLIESLLIINPREILNKLTFISQNLRLSHEEKLAIQVGDFFYEYAQFINKNTPEDSTILIPPQAFPWPKTGNAGYFRYFLYPRHLINGQNLEPGLNLASSDVDYVLIAWGETKTVEGGPDYGWPKFDVEAKKLVFFQMDKPSEAIFSDFKFSEMKNKELWGLIEVEKK